TPRRRPPPLARGGVSPIITSPLYARRIVSLSTAALVSHSQLEAAMCSRLAARSLADPQTRSRPDEAQSRKVKPSASPPRAQRVWPGAGGVVSADVALVDATSRALVRLGEKRLRALERRLTRVEYADPRLARVHRVRHERVKRREIVFRIGRKQGPKRLARHADVQAIHTVSVQLGQVVELAVVLGDDGRKRHLLVISQVTLGVVDEERVAGARPVGRAHDVHPVEV